METELISNIGDTNKVVYQKHQNIFPDKSSDKSLANSNKNRSSKPLNLSQKKDSDEKLSLREKIIIEKLKQRDREVRTHEMAHVLAGGPYVLGGPHYIFVIGPDGKLYAVGGEVKIDLTPVPNNPDATIRKAETIKRAALAPANPSAQDRAVAAKAEQMAMKARMEKLKKQQEKIYRDSEDFSIKKYNSFFNHSDNRSDVTSGFVSYIEQFNKKVSAVLANKAYKNNFSWFAPIHINSFV